MLLASIFLFYTTTDGGTSPQIVTILSLVIAGIALASGVLLIIAPTLMIRAGELFNRFYNVESLVYRYRNGYGVIFVLAGAILIYVLW